MLQAARAQSYAAALQHYKSEVGTEIIRDALTQRALKLQCVFAVGCGAGYLAAAACQHPCINVQAGLEVDSVKEQKVGSLNEGT